MKNLIKSEFRPAILPAIEEIPQIGIICSHAGRIERFAGLLTSVRCLTSYRGYKVYSGFYHGRAVFIAYVGIGAPSAAILIEELIAMGAKKIIRVGTNDNPQENATDDVVHVIEEAFGTKAMFGSESEKPARELVNTLAAKAQELGVRFEKSKSLHLDFYYSFLNPSAFAEYPAQIEETLARAESADIRIRDMESACLFYLGRLRGIQTASILHTILRHSVSQEYQNARDLETETCCGILALEALTQEEVL